jgi:hypothetical protein
VEIDQLRTIECRTREPVDAEHSFSEHHSVTSNLNGIRIWICTPEQYAAHGVEKHCSHLLVRYGPEIAEIGQKATRVVVLVAAAQTPSTQLLVSVWPPTHSRPIRLPRHKNSGVRHCDWGP